MGHIGRDLLHLDACAATRRAEVKCFDESVAPTRAELFELVQVGDRLRRIHQQCQHGCIRRNHEIILRCAAHGQLRYTERSVLEGQ